MCLSSRHRLAEQIGQQLIQTKQMLGLAESCTGGMAASTITDLAGSSAWFDSATVVYSNQAKHALLQVDLAEIAQYGAVSEQVAKSMALGLLAQGRCQITASVTGIAGPTGGSPEKPVGTVCFAWASHNGKILSQIKHFSGDRIAIREQSVETLFQGILQLLAYQ